MRIATWNVNSIRARLDRMVDWLGRSDVDVLAVQETKIPDESFPAAPFLDLGYEVAHHGTSQWNGVAVLSRIGIDEVQQGIDLLPGWGDPAVAEARALGARCAGVWVWSLYVPNGRAQDDPHFAYKLAWLDGLRRFAAGRLAERPDVQLVLCGDYNIAPTDDDVWDPEYYRPFTHTTPAERAGFQALLDAGFTDVVRPYTPGPGVFTYWDYQRLAFAKRRGMRIDFALASPALAARVTGALIDRQERKGKGASDHAPVIVELTDDHPEPPRRVPARPVPSPLPADPAAPDGPSADASTADASTADASTAEAATAGAPTADTSTAGATPGTSAVPSAPDAQPALFEEPWS
ncbi:exodeoxyribonuclease III [Nakamurella endophytica]|uniref:Exodeoxyribonuclease III n=1 Tax=Nakamurella endophytica TaxID=1748367 RepID=A0A917T6H4_9ACTN|nr:exodeoxyribonuclease III [Nakamurella endophytica]GGM12218.1 exodeoxyribonuclease III [Nakamurella endophytica]